LSTVNETANTNITDAKQSTTGWEDNFGSAISNTLKMALGNTPENSQSGGGKLVCSVLVDLNELDIDETRAEHRYFAANLDRYRSGAVGYLLFAEGLAKLCVRSRWVCKLVLPMARAMTKTFGSHNATLWQRCYAWLLVVVVSAVGWCATQLGVEVPQRVKDKYVRAAALRIGPMINLDSLNEHQKGIEQCAS